jgi:hypothetical protein
MLIASNVVQDQHVRFWLLADIAIEKQEVRF